MTRLQTLRNRREKLIELNGVHHYTQSNNPNIEIYFRMLLSIRKEISQIECVNVRPPKAKIGMTVKDLHNLTNPIL